MNSERKFKPGDMVECWPEDRDDLRRVGIVEEGTDDNGYLTVWILQVTARNGRLYGMCHGTFQQSKGYVRLLVPADSVGAGGGPMASTVDEVTDELNKMIAETSQAPSCPRCGSTDRAKRFNDDCGNDWHVQIERRVSQRRQKIQNVVGNPDPQFRRSGEDRRNDGSVQATCQDYAGGASPATPSAEDEGEEIPF